MRNIFITIVILLGSVPGFCTLELPKPELPAAGVVVYAPHPHFRWQREADVKIDEMHRIQIARDAAFADVVCDDRLEVVSRFVPAKPLEPHKYWWRVGRGAAAWSAAVPFEVREPEHLFTVRAGSDAAAVARIIQEAAAHTPARVNFEPGVYAITPEKGKSLVALEEVSDLIVDGHGAQLVLGGTFLRLQDCQRVTIQNFTVTPNRPGHTLVRILRKDNAKGLLVVKPEPGYDPDVPYYFQSDGNGGSLLGCMDAEHRGKYLLGGGISAHSKVPPHISPVAGEPGVFAFSPVPAATLDLMPLGAPAIVTTYRWQWLELIRGEECTLSHVTISDLPGAFSGGGSSAKSYLACKVKCRTPQDYFGGHSACGNGRIGEWIEDCEFECLADDGPAEQSFRTAIKGAEGVDAVLLGGTISPNSPQPGYRVSLADLKRLCGASATVVNVTQTSHGVRVQLDRPLAEMTTAMHCAMPLDWKSVFFYVDAPSNEDFVYRHNRHVGGRGHGMKFNGTRGLIEDSYFENINGNAVMAGFQSEVSGHGASDVLIRGNTIVRCGWTPICSESKSGLASNVIIKGNRISEVRDAAIYVRGYTGVTITGNEFVSTATPKAGAWVLCSDSNKIQCQSNRFAIGVPEIRIENKGK